jgi:hypothetical protein
MKHVGQLGTTGHSSTNNPDERQATGIAVPLWKVTSLPLEDAGAKLRARKYRS